VNDISLHSTSFTVQNVILDLFSSDPALGYVDALRDEAASVLAKFGGSWTRDAVRELKLIDSMIRESMRLNPFAIVGLPRTVRNFLPPFMLSELNNNARLCTLRAFDFPSLMCTFPKGQ
jgi:hypothetical protein